MQQASTTILPSSPHKILDPKKLTGLWLDGRMICIVFVVQQCNSSKCAIIIMMRRLQWNWTLFPSSPHFGLAKINLFSDAIVFCFVNYSEQLQKKLFQIQGWSQKIFEKNHTITLTCLINMHACLLGTFCFSKGKRSFCLSLLKLQNVPNKPACMFIWHIRVSMQGYIFEKKS